MKPEDFDLMLRSLDDALESREEARLKELLHSSADARDELQRYTQIRELVSQHGAGSFSPFFADRVMKRLAHREWESSRQPAFGFLTWKALGWSLAAVVVVFLAGIGLWLRPIERYVPYGRTTTLTLPDGSVVELSSGSTLRYRPFLGRKERTVDLTGEAFFTVERDEDRPFTVNTFNARVVVLGTEFNVKAWPDDPEKETAVTLSSGRVHFASLTSPAEPVVLEPGEMSVVRADTTRPLPPEKVPIERALAWRSGGFAYVNQPLGSVLRSLERRFDVEIRIDDPELANLPLTYLNPKPTSAADVLSDIAHVRNLRFRRSANGFEVMRH